MNAKKIMGAVLVALLAAALFVGAGAAVQDGETVFVYQNTSGLTGTWTYGAQAITAIPNDTSKNFGYFAGSNIVEGKYTDGSIDIIVKYPTATIVATAETNGIPYIIANGGVLYEGSSVTITNASAATVEAYDGYLVTFPNKTAKVVPDADINNIFTKSGKYQIQTVFNKSGFATGTPADVLISKAVFTFTVAGADDVTISADVESVLQDEVITVTITGQPGKIYNISGDFDVKGFGTVTQPIGETGNNITMPNTGKATIYVVASGSGDKDLTVALVNGQTIDSENKETLTINVIKGTITAETDKESYYIGNKVTLTGTSTASNTVYFYWVGTNVDFGKLNQTGTQTFSTTVKDDGTWKYELKGEKFQYYDAGTYTVYVSTASAATKVSELKTYETVSLVLKQPFISVTDAPAVAVIGSDYKVTGTAEAASNVYVYIFGTNFFEAGNKDTPIAALGGESIVSVDKNTFEVKFEVQNMSAGQYFMVIQHPMYDKEFNIQPAGSAIKLIDSGETLFTVDKRQTANAAQALCDALDTQNIDDMYVKLSFIVAAPTSTINPIPSEITKGSKLTVSGTTNLGKGETVTVEMLSTAFAAVPKETVGSASFIVLTTKTDENGNWEVTFDTSSLNVDEYSVSVAVGENLDKTSAKVNVIEGAPTEQPTTQPTETEQPTTQPTETEAPTTPGFGALAALAGLGAVAVLLLRRE